MKKRLIAIAIVAAFAVPYGARLLAKKDGGSEISRLKEKKAKLDDQIEKLQKEIDKSENLCQTLQTRGACEFSDEDVSAKGIELQRLKDKRQRTEEKIKASKKGGKKKDKPKAKKEKSSKKSKSKSEKK